MRTSWSRGQRIALRGAALGTMLLAAAAPASAQIFQDGASQDRDFVTGFLCLTPGCDTLRHPMTNDCICQKQNPAEQVVSRLRLTCSTTVNLRWVQCPVPAPYVINEPFETR